MIDKASTGICTDVRFHRIQNQLVTCGPNNGERQGLRKLSPPSKKISEFSTRRSAIAVAIVVLNKIPPQSEKRVFNAQSIFMRTGGDVRRDKGMHFKWMELSQRATQSALS